MTPSPMFLNLLSRRLKRVRSDLDYRILTALNTNWGISYGLLLALCIISSTDLQIAATVQIPIAFFTYNLFN